MFGLPLLDGDDEAVLDAGVGRDRLLEVGHAQLLAPHALGVLQRQLQRARVLKKVDLDEKFSVYV